MHGQKTSNHKKYLKRFCRWNVCIRTDEQIFSASVALISNMSWNWHTNIIPDTKCANCGPKRITIDWQSEIARCWVNDRCDAWAGARYESLRISERVPIPGSIYISDEQNAALLPLQHGLWSNFRSTKQKVSNSINNPFISINIIQNYYNAYWQYNIPFIQKYKR